MDTPATARRSSIVAETLRTLAALVEAGAAVNFTLTHGGYVVSVSPVGAAQADLTVNHPEISPAMLIPHFFSHIERAILRELAAHPGTGAKALIQRAGGKRLCADTTFWCLWSNLQQRGLVEDFEGTNEQADGEGGFERFEHTRRQGGGFQVSAPWIAELVAPTATEAAAASSRS